MALSICRAPSVRVGIAQALLVLFLFAVAASRPAVVHAQAATPAALETEMSAKQRNEMYISLGRDVAELERHGNILKTVVKLVSPAVVHIEAEKRDVPTRTGRGRLVEEAGSGAVIEIKNNFYVLTNRHVIKDAQLADIKVRLSDGRVMAPTKVWADPDTDVAVMAITAPGLVSARLGNSDTVEIGDFVLAVGSPFGLSHSVTYGIISAKGRRDLELGDGNVRFQDFMQTDAAINPGNSGGPLLNLRGELVGINTAIASNSGGNEGIGFSIPINMVMNVARQLIESGSVSRAFLGVTLDSKFTPALAAELGLPRRMGARVLRVSPGSPAETAQIQAGDVIIQFNRARVDDDTHLVNIVSMTPAGAEVPVVLYRNGQPVPLTVKMGTNAVPAVMTQPQQ
jgi:serine protease Do